MAGHDVMGLLSGRLLDLFEELVERPFLGTRRSVLDGQGRADARLGAARAHEVIGLAWLTTTRADVEATGREKRPPISNIP